MKKILRFIIAAPIAVPMVLIGYPLSRFFRFGSVMLLVGAWMLGLYEGAQ